MHRLTISHRFVVLAVDHKNVPHFVLGGLALKKVPPNGVADNVLLDKLGDAGCLRVVQTLLVAVGAVDAAALIDLGLGTRHTNPEFPTKSLRNTFLAE